jgi:hypothetical protein
VSQPNPPPLSSRPITASQAKTRRQKENVLQSQVITHSFSGAIGSPAKALLVRVAADLSAGGGFWNGPVDGLTRDFAYVAIPESSLVHCGLEKPYAALSSALGRFDVSLPEYLRMRNMHLDPDFEHLTYGDVGERGKQIRGYLEPGDLVVFYGALRDIRPSRQLVYAIIGLFVVDHLGAAVDVAAGNRDINAHSRRVLERDAPDVIVFGRPGASGRLTHCIPFGEYRDRAYRVRLDLLDEWGGLSVKDGYVQRSGRLPRFLDAARFLSWLEARNPTLVQENN